MKRNFIILGTVLLLAALFCLSAGAATGTLTVTLRYTDDRGGTMMLSGVTLRAVRVANAASDGYTPVAELQGLGLDARDLREDAPRDVAKLLEKEVTARRLPFLSAVTDRQGMAVFSVPSGGVYLVMQYSSADPRFARISPYLVEIRADGTASRTVETFPKTSLVSPAQIDQPIRDTSKTSPRTGASPLALPLVSLFSGVALLGGVCYNGKKGKQKKGDG